MLDIREILSDPRRFINLLLIGDEQEDMVDRYINSCRLFIGYIDGKPCACCAIKVVDTVTVEIKNLAVVAECRRHGVGRAMLEHVESLLSGNTFIIGTGETPSTLRFYQNCGYNYSHRIPDFFTDNYDHPIIEEGIQLKDMLYLSKRK